MANSGGKIISLKCYSDSEAPPIGLTVRGTGDFAVGLTAEDKVFSCRTNDKNCNQICVPLFKLTIWPTEGVTLTPVNRDLHCTVNEEVVSSEMNLVSGMSIEIGDKVIEYMEGPVPRARRHLPPTPGVHVRASPPPKPSRARQSPEPPVEVEKEEDSDWCHIELPTIESELVERLKTTEELANISACCINKQIHQFTDTRVTTGLMDQIYRMMLDVGAHRKDILKTFLQEMSTESEDTPESDKGRPLHNPVINLLVEILRQFMDPVVLVVLCLKLLRSLSHVPNNLHAFISCQATAAILGSMSVYISQEDIQQNGIDILCKIASYTPSLDEKAPMRETAIELILRAMKHHSSSLFVIQSGCRTLACLSNMMFEQAIHTIDNERSRKPCLRKGVEKLLGLLEYMSQNALEVIHEAMKTFTSDLSVTMEGRRFLYVMARLHQLKQKHILWLDSGQEEEEKGETTGEGTESGEPVEGILKRSRSYENLRNNERRVSFVDLYGPGVYDTTSSEDTSGSETRSPDPNLHSSENKSSDKTDNSMDQSQTLIPNGVDPSYTTQDIAEGLDQTNSVECNGVDEVVGDNGRPDVVTSTLGPVTEGNSVSLFSELGQIDPGLSRQLGGSEGGGNEGGREIWGDEGEPDIEHYATSDVKFLNRLVKTQIICRVCSLAFVDEDKQAYSMIEQPMSEILQQEKMAPALYKFFLTQYKPELTMMDFDTNAVISLIDAVRYRSQVAPGVVQKTLLGVARHVDKSVHPRHLRLAAVILSKTLEEPALLLTVSDASFHSHLRQQLSESTRSLSDPSIFSPVLDKLTPGHSLMDLDCY